MAYSKSYTRVHTTGWENEQDSYNTPLSAENLNIMDEGIDTLDDRIVSLDNAKADVSVLSDVFKDVSLNQQTGVLTFTKFDGTTKTLDTLLEKVVTNFDFDETTQKLTITLEDGSIKEVDLSSFISEYEFEDSDTIAWTVVNHKAVAVVKNHSIGADQLEVDYLTNCQIAEANAQASATSAETDALESEGWAVGTQNGIPVTSGSPYFENNARYWSDKAGTKTLASLDDVQISNLADKQSLVYDASIGKWVNGNSVAKYRLNAPTNVTATPFDESVSLTWTDPDDIKIGENTLAEWKHTLVVRKVGSAPVDEKDGTIVLTSTVRNQYATEGYVDNGLTNGVEYFYGIFPMTIDDVGNYSVSVSATPELGVGVRQWCATIGLSYENLDDITEQDMRALMTKHTSCDYFMSWYELDNTMIDQFIANQYAMKWIGLRDYICDKLMAISDFKTKALASANWEYILKDHVPIMTSNTEPYGTASAYQVFDGTSTTASATSFNYKFVDPTCVKKFDCSVSGGTLSGSNDGSTYTTIATPEDNENYYFYYRVSFTASKSVSSLQFYGRSLNVSVPTMTSNTQPYGEVIYDYNGASRDITPSTDMYKVFLPNGSIYMADHAVGQYVGYDFGKPVVVKLIKFTLDDANAHTSSDHVKVQASNDKSSWVDLSASIGGGARPSFYLQPSDAVAYRYYRVIVTELTSTSVYFNIRVLGFYGVDYSEHNDRTYLYDHGVELISFDNSGANYTFSTNSTTDGGYTKANGYLYANKPSTKLHSYNTGTDNTIDMTQYTKACELIEYATSYQLRVIDVSNVNQDAYVANSFSYYDTGHYFDDMAICKSKSGVTSSTSNIANNRIIDPTSIVKIKEIWLE